MAQNTVNAKAVITVLRTIAEAIKMAGPQGIPSGPLYAQLNGMGMSLDTYNMITQGMVDSGLIRIVNHCLIWVGPPKTITQVDITCPFCGTKQIIPVDPIGYAKWQSGALIQDALPTLTADQREALISGVCPPCWDKTTI